MYLILSRPIWCFTYIVSDGIIYDSIDGDELTNIDDSPLEYYYLVNKRLYNRFRSIEVKHLISGQII